MQKIGILGGTFDPIHFGHLKMAESAKKQLGLDKILIMPTGIPPHKNSKDVTETKHRVEMVKCAVFGNDDFEISYIDAENTKPCYTLNTLEELEKIYKDAKFFLIIGTDSLVTLNMWYHYTELFSKTAFAVIRRNSETNDEVIASSENYKKNYNAEIHFVDMPLVEISSTEIRKKVASGEKIDSMVPHAVEKYIKENGLYIGGDKF